MAEWLPFLLAALCLVLIPWAPGLIRLRIRFLRWIRWEWGARLFEKHFPFWCWFLRVALVTIAAASLVVGWTQ